MSVRALNALAAGRAPSCWKRETGRDRARLDTLPRACAWVEEIAAVNVKLRAEPLFGSCLSSFAGGPPQPHASEPSSHAPVRGGPDLDEPVRRLTSLPCAAAQARPTPGQLPAQADHALLRRLACETPRAADPEPPGRRAARRDGDPPEPPARRVRKATQACEADEREQPATTESRQPRRPTRQTLPPSDSRRATPAPVAQQRDWQDELGGRAGRVLARAGLPLTVPAAQGERWLDEAWASAVTGGTAAPLELLHRLASPTRTGRHSAGDRGPVASSDRGQVTTPGRAADFAPASRRTTSNAPDVSESSNDSAGAIAALDGQSFDRGTRAGTDADGLGRDGGGRARRATADGPTGLGRHSGIGEAGDEPAYASAHTRGRRASPDTQAYAPDADARAAPASDEYLGALPGGNLHTRDESADASEVWARHLAPPAVATQLPPLVPPRLAGVPAAAVASAKARQGAHDEATADEDLEVLAAKIKRILDDDARRHGIDV